MMSLQKVFGFRYAFNDRYFGIDVTAESEAEARVRIQAIAAAEFVSEFDPSGDSQPERLTLPQTRVGV